MTKYLGLVLNLSVLSPENATPIHSFELMWMSLAACMFGCLSVSVVQSQLYDIYTLLQYIGLLS